MELSKKEAKSSNTLFLPKSSHTSQILSVFRQGDIGQKGLPGPPGAPGYGLQGIKVSGCDRLSHRSFTRMMREEVVDNIKRDYHEMNLI